MNVVRKLFYLLILAGIPLSGAKAGNDEQPSGARRIALGGAFMGLGGDFWSLSGNPAALAGLEGPTAGIYLERRFMLSQLNHGAFGFAMPFQTKHYFGLDASGFGFASYSENRVGLAYATTFAEKFSLGVKANYSRTSIENYGGAGAFHIDAGFHAKVTKTFSAGFRVFNANQAWLNKIAGERMPTIYTFGMAWQPSEKALMVVDVEKNVNYPISVRGGVEYAFNKYLRARVGMSSAPVSFTAGLGVEVKKLKIDFASSYHQQLGFTPHLSLTWMFSKKGENETVTSTN
jgi:hypothetical protein